MENGFLNGLPELGLNNRRKKKRPSAPLTTAVVVRYHVMRCPNKKCNSRRLPVYKTELPVRYHKCLDCKIRFRSMEEEESEA